MTAQTLDPVTVADEVPKKKGYTVERPRVPLVWKLFGLTALLILIVVGLAVGITIERANRVANATVRSSITSAAKLFRQFEEQRLKRLEIVTEVLGNDAPFVALVQSALTGSLPEETLSPEAQAAAPAAPPAVAPPPVIDYSSINDNLLQRREQLGTDVLMLLDDQGILVARTDQPMVAGGTKEDFYDKSPLVKRIVEDNDIDQTSGVLALDGKLFHAAVAPVGAGARNVRIGYLINAYAIDEKFANNIAESTNAGVVFAPNGASTPVRSSNAPS
ncbi:MAG TPA: CHASE4 domain-containing protein, partial [Thermoanaerobaculia bacterium]|nr:CHASE4 domain-containing protein [Thermoanaerobaculia bacterium]